MGRKGPKPKTYNHFQVTLDKFLGSKNLWRKAIAKDGSCLFRAVAEQVLLSQTYHHRVRLQCADYIARHRDDFKEFLTVKVDEYLRRLRDGQLWGGEVELVVFSKMYRRSIVVFNQQENQVQEQIFYSPEDEAAGRRPEELIDPIFLAYSDGNHYDSVYMKRHKSNMAFCQSIVYSLLYERVFEETLSQSSKQRLKTLYDSEVQKLATEDKGDKHLTFLSKTYPIGVLEGMGQNCFSNTPLHVYQRERDSIEQQDRSVAAAIQFQVGDKCLVPVPGEQACFYNGEVSSTIKPNGCHMVYIFDVGEQWEIPCKDITVPTPSPSSASVRRSSGPPQAWSKVHQRIQPGVPRGRQGSDDTPPPSASSLPLPLPPDHILPIPSTASHLHNTQPHTSQLPTPTTPATATDANHTVPKTHQSLPKASTMTRTPSTSSKPYNKSPQVPSGSVPVSATRSSIPKVGVADVGVASQRGARKPGDILPTEPHGLRKEDVRRATGQSQGRPLSAGGSGLLGNAPPGFPASQESKTGPKTQKVPEGDKPANLPGRVSVPDSHARNPTDKKFPTQTASTSLPPASPQVSGGPTDLKVVPTAFAPLLVKTPAGPRGSLSTSDESASSSDESSNGQQAGNPVQSTANTVPFPLYCGHPMGRFMLPVLPEGQPSPTIPTPNPQSLQVASVLEQPLMHAPRPQSQPLTQPLPPLTAPSPQQIAGVVVGAVSSPPHHKVISQHSEAGRDSPYLEPQLRQVRSSQPEEAWPMVGEEEPHSREKTQDTPPTSSPAPMLARFMYPFGMPTPSTPDQAISMLRPTHMTAHRPPHLPSLHPGAPPPAGVQQQMFPFVFTHQPFPTAQLQHVEVETDTKEVQTSPSDFSRDQAVDVRPHTLSVGIQCSGVHRQERNTQTDVEGIEVPLFLPEDIKPPDVSEELMDLNLQIRFVTQYAMQCLDLYGRSDPEGAHSALRIVEGLTDSVLSAMEMNEKKLRAELREEVREEVKEEVREEVRGEIREEVREAVREEVRAEVREEVREEVGIMGHKPLNMDEQNFLQLFSNAQQGLPESFPGGRMVTLEDHGGQGGPFPHPSTSVQEKLQQSLGASIGDGSAPSFMKGDGREDDSGVQPHQEATVPPYHQMAPSPMMVPPGARPMMVTMPGMPPHMGWYPYMPFPMFMPPQIPPQMGVIPPMIPPMASDQGGAPDDQLQNEMPPSSEEQPEDFGTGSGGEGVTDGEVGAAETASAHCGMNGVVREESAEFSGGEDAVAAAEPPIAFPSADLQTDLDIDEIEDPAPTLSTLHNGATEDTPTQLPSPPTLDPVTTQVSGLDEISPSPQPADPPTTSNLPLPGEEASAQWDPEPAQSSPGGKDSSPHTPRPGLPCRRRDVNDIDRALESGEQAVQPVQPGREEKEDTVAAPSPPSSHKRYPPKGKSRQSNTHRGGKSREGTYQGAGKSHYHNARSGHHGGRQSQRYSQTSSTSPSEQQSPVPPTQPSSSTQSLNSSGGHAQTSPSDPPVSSSTQSKTPVVQTHSQTTKSSGSSGSSSVRNGSSEGVKKSVDGKSSADGGKGGLSGGKDGGTAGAKASVSVVAARGKGSGWGGKGGKGGGKGRGGGGGGGGGKDSSVGAKNSSEGGDGGEGTSAALVNDKSHSGTAGEVTEVKSAKHTFNRGGYQQKGQGFSRQRDGKKVSGGSGGQRSHRSPQQNHSQTPLSDSSDTATPQQQQKMREPAGGSGKLVKGEASKKGKRVNALPDSSSSQQEPTRSGASSKPRSDRMLAEPLPSFKNLYSSSPRDETNDVFPPLTQDSWPSFLSQQSDLNYPLPPPHCSPGSPISPPITGVCEQSSSPHFSYLYPPTWAHSTFDPTPPYCDLWSWTANSDTFIPTLLPTAADTESAT